MAMNPENRKAKPLNLWRLTVWGSAAALLLLLLVAQQFSDAMAWSPADFLLFGAMLTAACLGWEWVMQANRNLAWRAASAITLAGAFLLIWLNLAVGLFGSEEQPANWMHAGVLAVAAIGIGFARGRPRGMARALLATALAQCLAMLIALLIQVGDWRQTLVLSAGFIALWLTSAWLFRLARHDSPTAC